VHAVAVPPDVVQGRHRCARLAGRDGGQVDVGQPGRLGHAVRNVDAEPVDTAVQPEPQDALELGRHCGIRPVQVGLLRCEQV